MTDEELIEMYYANERPGKVVNEIHSRMGQLPEDWGEVVKYIHTLIENLSPISDEQLMDLNEVLR